MNFSLNILLGFMRIHKKECIQNPVNIKDGAFSENSFCFQLFWQSLHLRCLTGFSVFRQLKLRKIETLHKLVLMIMIGMTYMGQCKKAKSQLADFFDIISVFIKTNTVNGENQFCLHKDRCQIRIGTIAPILFELSNPVLATINHESNVQRVLRDGLIWLIFCLIKL